MNNADSLKRYFFIAVFVICACLSFVINTNRGVFLDDDNLYFYALSYKIYDKANWNIAEDKLISLSKASHASDNLITRLEDKKNYTYNYITPTVIWSLGRKAVFHFSGSAPYYSKVSNAIYAGFLIAFAFTFMCSLLILRLLRPSAKICASLAIFGLIALLGAYMPTAKPPVMMWLNLPGLKSKIIELLSFLIDPSYSFSPFSFTARNNFILIAFAAMMVRWQKKFTIFYMLVFAAFLFHASMGILFLMTVLFIDIVLRPNIFKNKAVVTSLILSLVYYFSVESLWSHVGIKGGYLAFALCLAAISVFALRKKFTEIFQSSLFGKITRNLHNMSVLYSDAILFTIGWLAALIPAVYINSHVSVEQSAYFWSQLHIRVLSIWQPFLLFACIHATLPSESDIKNTKYTALNIALLSFVIFATFLIMKQHDIINFYPKQNSTSAELMAKAVSKKGSAMELDPTFKNCKLTEAMIWYLHAQRAEEGGDPLSNYLDTRPKNQILDCTLLFK